ncbi:hexapeptide transferase [Formosa agariphila KMM 3901]|uniref:Serine acetyltransferase n=1 Tax=Formosa agariphila (strain DSM 15362 / KCTC 12365 / LMG 23005 / KMM 3901 / M-2Alg 35-1) TaxID=1347342 RepID=T2KPV4_FORAG|nr:serine O-acetyltransferase [Formosa agariphila]CDF80024.1 hexapeptide transferase [Formosa agariphila KMM 3901]
MLKAFKKDLNKYKAYSDSNTLVLLFTQQGLWALFVYRVSNSIYVSKTPLFIKRILLIFCLISQKGIEVLTGISLPYSATIGERFYIGHFGGIIVNANVIIGNNCNISQGVTIGVSGKDKNRGVPIIGNNVYIGANAVVVGKITVGDDAVIGANSLVTKDVLKCTTVLGVPAVKINDNDSNGYI